MVVEESVNVYFEETPPKSKSIELIDDLCEFETIRNIESEPPIKFIPLEASPPKENPWLFSFVLQLKSGRTHLIPKATQNDTDLKEKFFFVRRDSISDGKLLPLEWVKKAPKFDELVPARSDTDKRIEALLEIPIMERSFRNESAISEASFNTQYSEPGMSSGIPQSGSQFALSNLDSLLSGAVVVKKEGSTPASTKPRAPFLRSKALGSKKRKTTEVLEFEFFEGMDSAETTKKLQSLMNMGLEKLYANLSEAEKSAEEALEKVEDLKKILASKSKYLENEIQIQKNKLQESTTQYELRLQQTVEDAKKSAAMSIIQSRIQTAEQADAKGFDSAAWDLEG
ncbi:hypothetical protein L1987_59460 [Smallanthus sonchifolius]|uniref:Uncharacterized protein n=1 Tax=Smallanthus sonchifolius TaxID=185202 RepID=A0ACB9D5W6_9ASTR|nr:hypothetical protein L1987_59460 [Smallanthus sonchifolius]